MVFVLDDVIQELEDSRSLAPIKKLKRDELVQIADHYKLTVSPGLRKPEVYNLIADYCREHGIIDDLEEDPSVEVMRLKLEFQKNEREERRLAREERDAQAAREQAQVVCEQAACDEAEKLCDAQAVR